MLTLNPTHTIPTTTQWNSFLSIVADYRRAAPWKIVGYRHSVIAVESPLGRETAYCSIAPNLGYGVGVTVFLGEAGLRAFRSVLGEFNAPDGTTRIPQYGTEEHCRIRDAFVGMAFTISDDEIFPETRYRPIPLDPEEAGSGRLRFVDITCHAGGHEPREPNSIELDFLGDILLQLIATARREQREGDAFFRDAAPDRVWTLSPQIDPISLETEWEGSWKRPEIPIVPDFPETDGEVDRMSFLSGDPEADPEPDPFPPTAQELGLWRGLTKDLKGSDDVLLLIVTLEAIRVSPKNTPPIRRRLLGAISIVDAAFVASATLDDPREDPEEIRRAVLQMFQTREEIPRMIQAGERRLHDILAPMSRHFGFALLHTEMPPEITADFCAYIESHVTSVVDGQAPEGEFGIMTRKNHPDPIPSRPPSEGLRRIMLPLEHYCSENFPATLYQEALDLTAWLDYSDDPSPLERGRPEIWACGIAWFIASEHNLWHSPEDDRLTTDALCRWFGVKKRTADRRREKIREIVGGR